MDNKIIEEMARIIAFDLCPNRHVHAKWGEEAQCYSDNNFAECTKIKNVVDKLYNAGYRKIPENVDLFDTKTDGFMTSAIGDIPLNIDGMRKLVDEVSRLYIVQAELQELNAKYYNEAKDLRRKLNNDGAIYSRLEVDGFIDKARKETAEKFAEKVKEEGGHGAFGIYDETVDEILKEITEGEK